MPTKLRKDDGTYLDADDIGAEGEAVADTDALTGADLTDNSGGTGNATLTGVGDAATLTDNTGLSGSHDDTLAATTVPTITAVNPSAPTAYSADASMTDPVTKAQGEAVSAALATLRGEVATYETAISALVVDVGAILTLLTVMVQNQSDVAQKIIEMITDSADVKNNFADLAAMVDKHTVDNLAIRTTLEALKASLETGGSIAAE